MVLDFNKKFLNSIRKKIIPEEDINMIPTDGSIEDLDLFMKKIN